MPELAGQEEVISPETASGLRGPDTLRRALSFTEFVLSEDAALERGYKACRVVTPGLQAIKDSEASTTDYWQLIGQLSAEAALFSNRLKDVTAESGYVGLHNGMKLAFDIPHKVSRLSLKTFNAEYTWPVAALGSKGWQFSSQTEMRHPILGTARTQQICVADNGELGLLAHGYLGFAPKRIQWRVRHNDLSWVSDYTTRWSPPVLYKLGKTGTALANHIVRPERADTEQKRSQVLTALQSSLKKAYKHQVALLTNEIARLPKVLE